MSTYPIRELLAMWKSGRITNEQAIGHMMQHLLHIETTCPEFLDPERSRRSRRAGPWEEVPESEEEGDEGQGAGDEGQGASNG